MWGNKTLGAGASSSSSVLRTRRVVLIAIVVAAAGGAASSILRPSSPVPTHTGAMAHHRRNSHATSAVAPLVVDPAKARIKALSELKEGQDQVVRMKAQGIGGPATEK